MESKRQNKISKLLQKDISNLLGTLSNELFGNAMVSVTKVYVTKDLSIAKVYLSIFATKDKKEILDKISDNTKKIKYLLAKQIRHQLRVIPNIVFYEDDSLDYIENIENLLK